MGRREAVAGEGIVGAEDGEIFLEHQHATSRRLAVLEADGRCAWLYLTEPGSRRPEKDAFVYSPGLLADSERAKAEAKEGLPPSLAAAFASERAVIGDARGEEFAFRWSAEGQGVAVLRKGEPIAMIVPGSKYGYSKALARSGPYGEPWDQPTYDRVFGA
jgi:hypothetical protein